MYCYIQKPLSIYLLYTKMIIIRIDRRYFYSRDTLILELEWDEDEFYSFGSATKFIRGEIIIVLNF